MKKNVSFLFPLSVLMLVFGFQQARSETAVSLNTGPIMGWEHLSTATGDIELPGSSTEQTATLLFDIDNDGDNDFVIAGRQDPGPSMVWYRRHTNGWDKYLIEDAVLDIEAGGVFYDIDDDGDQDIVMGGDFNSNKIWWWENPAPNFSATTGWSRYEIKNSGDNIHHDQIFGDFDGDGADEFVFWNQAAWNGSDSDNGLYIAEIPDNPQLPWAFTRIYTGLGEGIAKGDVDQDGKVDLLAAGRWFKHEAGTTYMPYIIDANQEDGRLVIGDFNKDRLIDVVMVKGDAIGPLKWYTCVGDPTMSSCWISENLSGTQVDHGHSIDVGDLNLDGNPDIFVAEMRLNGGNEDAKMWAFLGDGTGNFETLVIAEGIGNHESRLGDLDQDGDPDILGKPFNWETPRIDIWLNETNGFIDEWERHVIDSAKPWRAIFVTAADVNGDDLQDIVTGGWWYENPGAPGDGWTRHTIGSPLRNMATVYDFDTDGDVDLIGTQGFGSNANSQFAWAQNDGLGNFTIFENVDDGIGSILQGVTVGHYQGTLEIILSWNDDIDSLQSLTVPNDLTVELWEWRQFSSVSLGEGLDTADIDGDGDHDLMLGVKWLRNDTDTWTPFTIHTPESGESDRTQMADMDRDGDLDTVVSYGHDPAGKVAWYERPSDPTTIWSEHLVANIVEPLSLSVIDLDRDHDADIIVGEHNLDSPGSSRLIIYENKDGRGGRWVEHIIYVGDEHHDGTQVADLDNDGDIDIFSIGWSHNRVIVYENKVEFSSFYMPVIANN